MVQCKYEQAAWEEARIRGAGLALLLSLLIIRHLSLIRSLLHAPSASLSLARFLFALSAAEKIIHERNRSV